MNAKEWLKDKGIHPTEPIYWDLVEKNITLEELLEEYAQHKLNSLNQQKIDREKCVDCDEAQEKKPKYGFCVYCDRRFD